MPLPLWFLYNVLDTRFKIRSEGHLWRVIVWSKSPTPLLNIWCHVNKADTSSRYIWWLVLDQSNATLCLLRVNICLAQFKKLTFIFISALIIHSIDSHLVLINHADWIILFSDGSRFPNKWGLIVVAQALWRLMRLALFFLEAHELILLREIMGYRCINESDLAQTVFLRLLVHFLRNSEWLLSLMPFL